MEPVELEAVGEPERGDSLRRSRILVHTEVDTTVTEHFGHMKFWGKKISFLSFMIDEPELTMFSTI